MGVTECKSIRSERGRMRAAPRQVLLEFPRSLLSAEPIWNFTLVVPLYSQWAPPITNRFFKVALDQWTVPKTLHEEISIER